MGSAGVPDPEETYDRAISQRVQARPRAREAAESRSQGERVRQRRGHRATAGRACAARSCSDQDRGGRAPGAARRRCARRAAADGRGGRPAPSLPAVAEPAPKPAEPAPKPAAPPPRPVAEGLHEMPMPDFEKLSRNVARFVEEGGKALAAYMKPVETGDRRRSAPKPELAEVFTTLGRVAEYYAADAQRAFEAQPTLSTQFFDLWGSTLQRLARRGDAAPSPRPTPATSASPIRNGQANPYFDFIKQAYVLTTRWARRSRAPRRRDSTRTRATRPRFYMKQVTQRAVALEFPRHQSGTAARHARRKRREPRARHEDDRRGHRGRPRPVAHPPVRRGEVQARRQSRRDARQGRSSATS